MFRSYILIIFSSFIFIFSVGINLSYSSTAAWGVMCWDYSYKDVRNEFILLGYEYPTIGSKVTFDDEISISKWSDFLKGQGYPTSLYVTEVYDDSFFGDKKSINSIFLSSKDSSLYLEIYVNDQISDGLYKALATFVINSLTENSPKTGVTYNNCEFFQ